MRPIRPADPAVRRSSLPFDFRPIPAARAARPRHPEPRTPHGCAIAIVTDAWKPQVNGVVTTLSETARCLSADGHVVELFTPARLPAYPLSDYPEIGSACCPDADSRTLLEEFAPIACTIATEGPLGIAARRHCLRTGMPFTTSYHTQFPQYLRARAPIPTSWSYAFLRWFHGPALRTLVATESMRRDLLDHGFQRVGLWSRGGRHEPVPSARQETTCARSARSSCTRAASPSRKGSRHFSRSTRRARSTSSVTGRRCLRCGGGYPNAVYAGYRFGEELARHVAARRRVRVPQSNGYLRPRDAGSARVWRPGRSLSRAGPHRRRRARRHAARSPRI
jgi:hypothetical protein